MEFSKENLLQISESVNDLICILNTSLEIEYINLKAHFKVLGYINEDLVGKKIRKIFDLNDFNKIQKIIKNRNFDGLESEDLQIYHKNGYKFWFEVKFIQFIDKKGEKKIALVSRDISEKKQAELTLKNSKGRYQRLIKSVKEGYYEVDLKGNFTFVNKALSRFIGYSQEEMIGQSYKKITDRTKRKLVFKTFNKVFKTEVQQNIIQLQVVKRNGEKVFLETSIYLKYDSENKKIGFYGIIRDITERKKGEELEEKFKIDLAQRVKLRTKELKESEDKYSNLFQHSNDGIFLHDLDGNITDVNRKVLEQLGYTKSEILSLKVSQLHPTSEMVESKKAFDKISENGFVRFEVNFKKKNGEIFPAEVSSSLFTIGGEKVIQGILRDITDRKLSELMLKESEEKYRSMVNNLDLGFYQVDWDGNLLNYNPAFASLFGFEPDEDITNINVKKFWQDPNERGIYLNELNKDGFIKNYLVHSKKRDGQKIVLQLNSHLIKNIDEKPIKIQGVISDITEKFDLEQKVKESESRYRNLIESVPFSIALIDQGGKVIYCNPATEKLLGYKREELIGNEFRSLPVINQKYLPMMLKRFKKVANGEILPPFDVELNKKDGSLIWIKYQTSLVKLGDYFLIQAVLNDITERKSADLLIQEEIQKLKELDQIRKDLISRVSHELKTPLVSICGGSELLLELFGSDIKEEARELAEIIGKGGTRLKNLVDNLVDVTRIEYNKFELEIELINISDVLQDCAKEMMYLIKKREINFQLDLPDTLIVNIDRVRIEQVVLNILSNAIKNTPPNGKVVMKLTKKKEWVEFLVNDSGIGLTREEMDRIFTRFGKIERYGPGLEYIDIQGSGLGLFISKEIIDLHKGHIWAESGGRDKGSTFTIKLPIS